MHYKQVASQPRILVLIFETGDEIFSTLSQFATEHKLAGSSFKAIGGFSQAKLGWFDWQTKTYDVAADFDEQLELLSLIGDIATENGKPKGHAHVVVGRKDGTAHGGHLMTAHVRPTCELVLTENPAHLHKQIDPDSGVALIRV